MGSTPDPVTATTVFQNQSQALQGTDTKFVIIDVNGKLWNLAGNWAGLEGLTLAPHNTGLMHGPFTSLFSEGPYQIGAHYERTDWKRRQINIGVMVGIDYGPDTSGWRYRRLEQSWWSGWAVDRDCYLGCYTRTSGWRWLKVRLAEEPKTAFELDPLAFDNNFMQWDMVITAVQPFWCKRWLSSSWTNTSATATDVAVIQDILDNLVNKFIGSALAGNGGTLVPGKDIGSGHLQFWNNGDRQDYAKYLVTAPGQAWIQDGIDGPMIELPLLTENDGTILVDTDPTARTITSVTDPTDPLLFKILRNAQFIDVFLDPLLETTLPVWKRFKYRFQNSIPPQTQATIQVYHSNHDGVVTALMPQRYYRAYS